MDLTFVPQYIGDGPKRKRVLKACEACKRRKKRCVHVDAIQGLDQSKSYSPPQATATLETSHPADKSAFNESDEIDLSLLSKKDHSNLGSRDGFPSTHMGTVSTSLVERSSSYSAQSPATHRFIGDLNPEATFLQQGLTTPDSEPPSYREKVGVWLDKSEWDALIRHREAISLDAGLANDDSMQNILDHASYSRWAQDTAILGSSDQAAVIEIYFSKIHPIFPLIDEDEFRQNYRDKTISKTLIQAVCLVIAKDECAEPYLRLSANPTVILKPRDFCKKMYTSIVETLKNNLRSDKLTLIRILALTSLHSEGPDGAEQASMHLAQAIHHAVTIGLHIGRTDNSIDDEPLKRVFWCLWSLDKLNAATNGRPVMIADHDLGVSIYSISQSGNKAFMVWLRLSSMLDKVISFYRPSAPSTVTGWEDDFPGFEELIDQFEGWDMPSNVLATLQLFYLIIAVLSSRSRGVKRIPRSTPSYIRQSLSALHIITLMSGESYQDLHPFPLLPYGISLALSVSYKQIRQHQLVYQQEKAKQDFRACFKILQILRHKWWSANIMATLAGRVLGEVERSSSLASFRLQRGSKDCAQGIGIDPASASTREADIQESDGHLGPVIGRPLSTHNGRANRQKMSLPTLFKDQEADQIKERDNINLSEDTHGGIGTAFDGIDDVFGSYLDPNLPINLDDFLFMDDMDQAAERLENITRRDL